MSHVTHTKVAVIGTGFGGLGLGVQLRRAGITDFVLLERANDVGGTWRDNTYPGAACDIESVLYSFSFAPNPNWSRAFASQAEIHGYLTGVVEQFGLGEHLRFGAEVLDATWDDATATWTIKTTTGDLTADFLVSASGTLSDPSIPNIAGIESFKGEMFHSATWNHDLDLTGLRVGVVGTGASAIQFVPEIQPIVGKLSVFQRTPTWVIPRHDKPVPATVQSLFKSVPLTLQALRGMRYVTREALVPGLTKNKMFLAPVQKMAKKHLAEQVSDPELRAKLTPNFSLGCKRILISNQWYPALAQDNVDLVTDGIAEITESGVVTTDGTTHDLDVIILSTGFQATQPPIATRIHGREGQSLAAAWADGGMRAYRGITVAGFPNYFIINGPNLAVGHTSMVYMIESQVAYIVDALEKMAAKRLSVVEVTSEAEATYTSELHKAGANSVWLTGGCASWYLDEEGRNTTLWPHSSFAYRNMTKEFDLNTYRTVRTADQAGTETELEAQR